MYHAVTKKRIRKQRVSPAPTERGFTLIESLVAIAVLLLAVVGPLTVATRSLTSAAFARDQITAFYLGQEAIELIRNKRDNNAIADNDWLTGFSECTGGSVCRVDATKDIEASDAIETCGGTCPPLQQNSSGLYGYGTGWYDTRFTRSVEIEAIGDGEMKIETIVSWNTGVLSKQITIEEHLFDWQ